MSNIRIRRKKEDSELLIRQVGDRLLMYVNGPLAKDMLVRGGASRLTTKDSELEKYEAIVVLEEGDALVIDAVS